MRYFQQIAGGVEVLPLVLDLYRQPALWNQHTARTGSDGYFAGTDDIWVRFRSPDELTSREAFAEEFRCRWYSAWYALPHLRPIVFGLMARVEAVELGAVLITRVPRGQQVAPHDDRGRWHSEYFQTKAYLPLASNPQCYNTCGGERVIMQVGDVWLFDNLQEHSTVNSDGETEVTLIVCMKCEWGAEHQPVAPSACMLACMRRPGSRVWTLLPPTRASQDHIRTWSVGVVRVWQDDEMLGDFVGPIDHPALALQSF